MKAYIQNMSKSAQFAQLSKKKSYGYYCNLCIKYGFSRLTKQHYESRMIMIIEDRYRSRTYDQRMERYRQFTD